MIAEEQQKNASIGEHKSSKKCQKWRILKQLYSRKQASITFFSLFFYNIAIFSSIAKNSGVAKNTAKNSGVAKNTAKNTAKITAIFSGVA